MEQHDIAEVVAIEQAANQHPWSMKNFKDCLKAGHRAWVFINDQQELIGYTIVQQVVDEAHLLNICVKPSLQGQGIGRKILDHVIAFANSVSSVLIVLEVRRSNDRAQQLYSQAGFNEMSVRKDYYPAEQGREDAILMGMDLSFLV
ncbi:MAG: ribosomal-protein-alanine N-acetyltransferase [Gammaproteobacteria bacterium]|nr:MAG: ribosomal-protein-alanine N-acetyltransferase [Gammaproteobacteria bacterium]RKZ94123.1 MAG: ribosomal-protein-alanine N-acetyltransferase [Gammaproteobacteria bacterium]RKZ97804.1 MAG: ribosomal-protein-alanine N-acetyltransferase [Gammaproteobacteria bacterium]